jgi:hypothetical protein
MCENGTPSSTGFNGTMTVWHITVKTGPMSAMMCGESYEEVIMSGCGIVTRYAYKRADKYRDYCQACVNRLPLYELVETDLEGTEEPKLHVLHSTTTSLVLPAHFSTWAVNTHCYVTASKITEARVSLLENKVEVLFTHFMINDPAAGIAISQHALLNTCGFQKFLTLHCVDGAIIDPNSVLLVAQEL